MTATNEVQHILALEIVGRARESQEDLTRSLAILQEIVLSTDTLHERSAGEVVSFPSRGELYLFFADDQGAPVRCALELTELFTELPSLSIRMAIHTGPVRFGSGEASGDAMEVVGSLLADGKEGQLLLSETYAQALQAEYAEHLRTDAETGRFVIDPQKVFVIAASRRPLLRTLETALAVDGHQIDDDQESPTDVAWARSLEPRIRSADTVVVLMPVDSGWNDLLQYQVEIAEDERRKRGRPHILHVWLNETEPAGARPTTDEDQVVGFVRSALATGPVEVDPESIGVAGGAVPFDSPFYVRRSADADLERAIARNESIILLKGPRQIGKTSLIGHGITEADNRGFCTVVTDFQKLSSHQLQSDEAFCRVIATTLAKDLNIPFDFDEEWLEPLGANLNLDRFVRMFLESSPGQVVWFIDEADRLFTSPFASEFFGLVRSWHNSRATDRKGPWRRLTVVIGYATEAHLFIKDLNQSPFNVGCNVPIPMFNVENVADLNARYGRPIVSDAEVARLHELVAGQPFLIRRALDVLVRNQQSFEELLATSADDDGPFADHLKRVLVSVTQLPEVWDALAESITDPHVPESDAIYRLIAAGILVRTGPKSAELRCELYRRFLARYTTS